MSRLKEVFRIYIYLKPTQFYESNFHIPSSDIPSVAFAVYRQRAGEQADRIVGGNGGGSSHNADALCMDIRRLH